MVINSLGQATAGRGPDMNAAAADLSSVATDLRVLAHTLASNSDHLDALIADLRKVMDTLAAWHADFRAMITDWDHVMATLASREQNLKGTIVEQDRVMAILDQALSGGAAQQLHGAIAEGPATIDNANHYLADSTRVFGVVQSDTPGIAQLFNELASVMSGIGGAQEDGPDKGKTVHMWRVYCAGNVFHQPPTTLMHRRTIVSVVLVIAFASVCLGGLGYVGDEHGAERPLEFRDFHLQAQLHHRQRAGAPGGGARLRRPRRLGGRIGDVPRMAAPWSRCGCNPASSCARARAP